MSDISTLNGNPTLKNKLRALRWVWLVAFLMVLGVWAAAVPARFQELSLDLYNFGPALRDLGLTVGFFSAYATALDASVMLAFILVGTLIFWRKSNDRTAIWFSLALILMPVILTPLSPSIYRIYPAWRIPILLIRSIAGVTAD